MAKATKVQTCDDGCDEERDNEKKVMMMMNPLKMN
jgi:hypothetical protein